MIFRHPEWLALLPLVLLIGWWLRWQGLFRPLRLLLIGLTVLTLMRPQWRRLADGVDVWMLVDNSVSAESAIARGLPEWQKLLERSRGRDDRLIRLDYAAEVVRHGAEGGALYDRQRQSTLTGQAISQTLTLAQKESQGRPARVLLFTDGYASEAMTGVAEKLQNQGVELDYRLTREASPNDWRVSAMRLPTRVQVNEPFLIEIEVRGPGNATVPLKLLRQGKELQASEVSMSLGSGRARFMDRIGIAGAVQYEAVILPAGDAHPGNNRHQAIVEIAGGPRVLLVTAYNNDPTFEVLKRQGFSVEKITDLQSLKPAHLAGTKCVILNNVPAYEMPGDFVSALDFYVREQGGGLMMGGGKHSFAAGGWFESPLDPLLPVSMELKQEHRKLMVAMAIVMDRSGSMAATVNNGFTKMSLANEGAGNAIRFLGAQDLLTVFAVDSVAHSVVPLQPVGPNRAQMESSVRRIESTGGGIFVYEGLKAAWDQLKKAPAGQRHIILFSDAADSEEPGDYKRLIKEITDNGGSLSVIALGTRSDVDAKLLEEIATLGKGRLFFTNKAEELPSIFSQETVAVARSAFIADPVKTKASNGWFEISSQPLTWTSEVDGYNLSYLRDWASQALLSEDDYKAPLVAFGQRGIGRTAAISFPLGGEHSDKVRGWDKYGDFLQTLTRWLMGEEMPPGIGLKHRLEGTSLFLDLLHDESWEERMMARPPRVLLAEGSTVSAPQEIAWERLSPGHYQARASLPEGEMVRGAIQVGSQALAFGPVLVGTSSEWAFDEARTEELRQISRASGGRELLEMSEAWRNPPVERFTDLRSELLVALLALMLLEALVTRTGWRLPGWNLQGRAVRAAGQKAKNKVPAKPAANASPAAAATAPATGTAAAQSGPAPTASNEPQDAASRQSRFNRAKRH